MKQLMMTRERKWAMQIQNQKTKEIYNKLTLLSLMALRRSIFIGIARHIYMFHLVNHWPISMPSM